MVRPLRVQYPGAVYHVTHRGNERRNIFEDDTDRNQFLKILFRAQHTYNGILHSYVLMNNHFHILVETPRGNLSEFMRYFNVTYTSYFNRTHGRSGHLYRGRYKSFLIEKEAYLSRVSRYIHLNPVRVNNMRMKSVKEQLDYLFSYAWSSLPGFIHVSGRLAMITYGYVLEEFGGDNKVGRIAYDKQIKEDVTGGLTITDAVVGQSILGDDDFIAHIREKYLPVGKDRERPVVGVVSRHLAKDTILTAIREATAESEEDILTKPGMIRQVAMDMLYRHGGMTNPDIGRLMGIGYSTVSQGRKRLRVRVEKDKDVAALVHVIEQRCQG